MAFAFPVGMAGHDVLIGGADEANLPSGFEALQSEPCVVRAPADGPDLRSGASPKVDVRADPQLR